MKEQLKTWLKSEQNKLDIIIANSAVNFYNINKDKSNFKYDLKQCHIESYNLVKGKDLCYDRPNTAFAYSLWYHPRRVNTFLSFFIDQIIDHQEEHIQLFDLGAGAGAIQWGLGLIYVGLKKLGKTPPKITVINIDTSPFMLEYNRDFLWKEFVKTYPEIDNTFIVEYEVNSWNNERDLETSNPILSASYLFDASDNKSEIANDFKELVKKYKPKTVLLLTSDQEVKRPLIDEVEVEFKRQGFNSQKVSETRLLFNNQLEHINKTRIWLAQKYNISELHNKAYWNDKSHYGLVLQKPQSEITFSNGVNKISNIDIFNPPITVRKDVVLNDKQKRAARNSDTPSVIVGPAGCGKSIVITEKVKNIVEENKYDPNLKILITTFNKGLISKLAEWLNDLLDKTKYTFKYDVNSYRGTNEKSSNFIFNESSETNIKLLHFDMLPKLLGGVRYRGLVEHSKHFNLLDEIIQKVRIDEKINNDLYDNILNHDFLFEEYNRVIYGLQVGIAGAENTYLEISRKGRGNNPSLQRKSYRRILVFKCLKNYALRMHNEGIESFTLRRQYLHSLLKSGSLKAKYDYILVDEFQDCTKADIDIFFKLLKSDKQNNFSLAGDLAQSVHLGTSARVDSIREVIREGRELDNIQWTFLEGSYRLPVRISEAIKGISKAINARFNEEKAASIITPYKGSPPGARPIVVFGNSTTELADKILELFKTYKIYDLNSITILEKDIELLKELNNKGLASETDTILSLKGLEKECVLWSTRIPLEFEKEVFEFAYTIVTRTSCILIIALTDKTQNVYKKILGLLEKDRLIFWDNITESKFETFCEEYKMETIEDEE